MNVRVRPRVKLWEKSKTDEAIGMQRGNFQKEKLVKRSQERWEGRERRKSFGEPTVVMATI